MAQQTADEIRAEIARVGEEYDRLIAKKEEERELTVVGLKEQTKGIAKAKRAKASALRKLYLALGKAEAGA
jgi:hypothetical protein